MAATIRVVVFSGGRGTSTILKAMSQHPQIDLTSIVNAYDDGLSTGRLRAFLPGMLGPSDLRKNMASLMPQAERCQRALKTFLDHRFPVGASRESAVRDLRRITSLDGHELSEAPLAAAYVELSARQAATLAGYCRTFLDYEESQEAKGVHFDYGDCAVGNLLFSGCYLEAGSDFNRTVDAFSALCEIRGRAVNVTDGRNYVLVGVKEDGTFLRNETVIVSPQDAVSIREIFLLDDYLAPEEEAKLSGLGLEEKLAALRPRARTPVPNPVALEAIARADLIIYGPGTQHSSLYPSYLTDGVGEALAANKDAEKVFVANISHDHDIGSDSVQMLISKFVHYASRAGRISLAPEALMTQVVVQEPDASNVNRVSGAKYVELTADALPPSVVVRRSDWESGAGKHAGGQILDKLLDSVKSALTFPVIPHRHMVTIVIPVLNEARTLGRVLDAVGALELPFPDMAKDIVVVDGGSTDGSVEIASSRKFVRLYHLDAPTGRGAAIRYGIEKARGNIVAIFPSDGEYEASDIPAVIGPIIDNRFFAVIGSRAIKCINLEENIRRIYGSDRVGFWLSKYGGMALSILSLLLYNRYVSDPLSTLKAFDSNLLGALDLQCDGVDLETEIIAKLALRQQFILEVPVQYAPRTRAEGKKTSWGDGIKALFTLIRLRRTGGVRPARLEAAASLETVKLTSAQDRR